MGTLHSTRRHRTPQVVEKVGAPCRIRTCDLLVRSQTLYPAELRARWVETKRGGARTSLGTAPARKYSTPPRNEDGLGRPFGAGFRVHDADQVGGRFIYHHMIWSTQIVGEEGEDEDRDRSTTTGWPVHEVGGTRTSSTRRPAGNCRPTRASCPIRSICTRTAVTPPHTWRSAGSSTRRATSRSFAGSGVVSGTRSTSTSGRWRPIKNCAPTRCSNRSRRSAPSSRICTRRASGCVWRRSGA